MSTNNRTEKVRRAANLLTYFAVAAIVPLSFALAWTKTDARHEMNIRDTFNAVNGADYRTAGKDRCYYKTDKPLTISFRNGPDLTKLWLSRDFWLHKMHLADNPRGQPVEAGKLPYFTPVDCRFVGGPVKIYHGASEILEETADARKQLAAKIKMLAKSGGNTSRFIVSVPKP